MVSTVLETRMFHNAFAVLRLETDMCVWLLLLETTADYVLLHVLTHQICVRVVVVVVVCVDRLLMLWGTNYLSMVC